MDSRVLDGLVTKAAVPREESLLHQTYHVTHPQKQFAVHSFQKRETGSQQQYTTRTTQPYTHTMITYKNIYHITGHLQHENFTDLAPFHGVGQHL